MPEETHILVEPIDEPDLSTEELRRVALADKSISAMLGDPGPGDLIVSRPEFTGRTVDDRSAFRTLFYSTASGQAVEVTGRGKAPYEIVATPSAHVPRPEPAELRDAAGLLRADPGFAEYADKPDVVIYQPMPPLANVELDDGTLRRRVTLAVYNPAGGPRHRIAAVDLRDRKVEWSPQGVDVASDHDCESRQPEGVESRPDRTGPARMRIRVVRGNTELWNLVVVRPRDSGPATYDKGSGVELREVKYRGRQLLYRAHVPILNVLYDDGVTFRDWQNEETPFLAVGHDRAAGWRTCTEPPATILESGTDAGNFQGVALWYDDGELRIVSEVQAGWYRYVSDWRLRDDGVLKPRFGFAGTRNPRTCKRHQHHVYWRLDFSIGGAANDIVERQQRPAPNQPVWVRLKREGRAKRSNATRSWRVLDKVSRRGYRIVPGLVDGTADSYGVADLWYLRYHRNEVDDGVSVVGGDPADTQIQINRFVNGENIDGADVVVWYAGHFLHDEQHPSPHVGHIVGPELRPVNWA